MHWCTVCCKVIYPPPLEGTVHLYKPHPHPLSPLCHCFGFPWISPFLDHIKLLLLSHTPITTRSGHLLEQKPLQITNTHQQSRSSKQWRCARHQITSTWAWLCMQAASDRWRDYVMLSSCDDMSKLSTLLLSVSLYSLFFFFHFNSHQAHRVMSQEDFRKASSAETFSTADTNKGWWCWDV